MKIRILSALLCCFLLFAALSFSGCEQLKQLKSAPAGNATVYEEELESSTGKWYLLDENNEKTDTFFEFRGGKSEMTFTYWEQNEAVVSGSYRVSYNGNDGTNTHTFCWNLKPTGSEKEDWVSCYADGFETDFTQFTVIKEEQDLGITDGRVYSHIYRVSELPYRMGTYVLEGHSFRQETDNYRYANKSQIPAGTYRLSETVSITFVMPKPYSYALFSYRNGDQTVEGVYWTASDRKTIYLYIEHDPYEYIRKDDQAKYDMTFSHDYPPDFYLRGDFPATGDAIEIRELYHHEYSQTAVPDSVWKFGTYRR